VGRLLGWGRGGVAAPASLSTLPKPLDPPPPPQEFVSLFKEPEFRQLGSSLKLIMVGARGWGVGQGEG
jgi:hypothetical protein